MQNVVQLPEKQSTQQDVQDLPHPAKGLLSFWGVKIFGWFTIIGYTRINFRITLRLTWFYIKHNIHKQFG